MLTRPRGRATLKNDMHQATRTLFFTFLVCSNNSNEYQVVNEVENRATAPTPSCLYFALGFLQLFLITESAIVLVSTIFTRTPTHFQMHANACVHSPIILSRSAALPLRHTRACILQAQNIAARSTLARSQHPLAQALTHSYGCSLALSRYFAGTNVNHTRSLIRMHAIYHCLAIAQARR